MIVAVDTGGTKTLVAVFDTDGTIVAERKFPTPPALSDYLSQLTATIDDLLAGTDASCLSVALPGSIRDGVMVWAGNLGWHDTDIRALLAEHYDCPIIVENDANLAGLAEARSLPSVPPICLYVTVSTGIGTGVILNGKIDPLLARTEGGHIVLRTDDGLKQWESFASGKAMKARYGLLASEIEDEATWRVISDDIAAGLLTLIPFLQPDAVVIGGGVGAHFDKFSGYLLPTLKQQLLPTLMPTVTQAVHPEEAVIYGCYYHALDVAA